MFQAPHPLGPWTRQPGTVNLACTAHADVADYVDVGAVPTPGQGCLYNGSSDTSTTRSQQNFVVQVEVANGDGESETQYWWTGDRWQQAPDGIKGHEPQFWVPLRFDASGNIEDVRWVDSFSANVVVREPL